MTNRVFLLPVRRGVAMFRWNGRSLDECANSYRETAYRSSLAALETDADVRVRLASDSYSNAHPNAARHVFEQWRGCFDGDPTLDRVVPIPTSLGYPTPHCALKDDMLFVGGTLETARLVSLDLEETSARWRVLAPLPEPSESRAHDTIRALCVDGDRLLCVDTVLGQFDPRWLVFDVSNPREACPAATVAIERNSAAPPTGEYVERVICCGRFIVALTRSQFVHGWNYWLRFFDRHTLRSRGCWPQSYYDSWDFADAPAVAGCDELLAERNHGGVRLFDLRAIDQGAVGTHDKPAAVHSIEREGRTATQLHFCDQAHLVVA